MNALGLSPQQVEARRSYVQAGDAGQIARRLMAIPHSGCWVWLGALNDHGYGVARIDGKMWRVHRFMFLAAGSVIPPGMVLDHKCRVRSCVNPAHLEPVTQRENIIRGDGPRRQKERHAAITHCPRGHSYKEFGASSLGGGKYSCRRCRECQRLAWHERKRR